MKLFAFILLLLIPLFVQTAEGQYHVTHIRTFGTVGVTKLNQNFWGYDNGTSITSVTLTTGSNNPYLNGVNALSIAPVCASSQFSYGSVSCGDGLDPANTTISEGDPRPLSIQQDSPIDTCAYLYDRGHRLWEDGYPESWAKANDTLRFFIESCAQSMTAADGFPAFAAFDLIATSVYGMDTINTRWLNLRDWLKRVLFLSSDSGYYCADVEEMMATFNYYVPGKGTDVNAAIGVMDYILSTNRCPYLNADWLKGRTAARTKQVQNWLALGKDTLWTPLDTSTTSIDSSGFSILRGQQFASALPSTRLHGEGLPMMTVTNNPFTDETTLETTLADASMLKLEIFDVLGKQLYTENKFFTSGAVRWQIDGKALPKGTLYARVSTINGAVQTIKLIRGE